MADAKKKPSLALLIGMGKGKGPKAVEDAPSEESINDEEGSSLDAAHALLDAIKADDAEGVDAALKAHYDLCDDDSAVA